jgi:hypothetical protein
MITEPRRLQHAVQGATLADVLERVLDKGVVIAGDIKIKLVDIELLTIQIRLVVASVDKAVEMGMNWWTFNPDLHSDHREAEREQEIAGLRERIAALEAVEAGEPVVRSGKAGG